MADRQVAVVGAGLIGCSWAAYSAGEFTRVRDQRQLGVLEIQSRYPLPDGDENAP